MGEGSRIAWTDHTFNPYWGCTPVSPGCANCYAATFAHRLGLDVFGAGTSRRFFGDSHWNEPLKWARKAQEAGVRARVFCGSMCDVLEDRDELAPHRERLWDLITKTADSLDWLLLTKRPGNATEMLPPPISELCWMGTTVENQAAACARIDDLIAIPARLHFVSAEPLLGWLKLHWLECIPGIDWVIVGGESGPKARPLDLDAVRSLRDQCAAAGVPFFFKQHGEWCPPDQLPDHVFRDVEAVDTDATVSRQPLRVGVKRAGHLLDGVSHRDFPEVAR